MSTTISRRRRVAAGLTLAFAVTGGAVGTAAPAQAATIDPAVPYRLPAGASMKAGQSLTVAQYRLSFQSDGNAVLQGNGRALWTTNTAGKAIGGRLEMGTDGIARVRTSTGATVWSSGPATPGSNLNVSNWGAVWTGQGAGPALWSNGRPGSEALSAGGTLGPGQFLISRNGKAKLLMQTDGRLAQVGTKGGNVWSVKCDSGSKLSMLGDGSLRVTTPAGVVCWKTAAMTGTSPRLIVQDDDRLIRTAGTSRAQLTPVAAWNDYYMGPHAAAVFKQLNAERARHGLKPLVFDTRLHTAAQRHNLQMAANNKLSHQLTGELPMGERITAAGYRWSRAAENCAWTTDITIAGALGMESRMYNEVAPNDGHRRNILDPNLVHVGVAVHHDKTNGKLWLTQDFGRPA